MIQLTRNVSLPHHRIKLSQGFFKDLRMWEDFICNWNGAGFFMPSHWVTSDVLSVHRCLWFSGICGHFSNPLVSGLMIFCDNESVVSIVNTKRSRIPRVMDVVRHLTLLTLRFNFCIRAEHIEGKRNEVADSLSRFQMGRFRELAPHAKRDPCLVPPGLILQSGPTVQGKNVLSSSSPSIDL